MPIANGVFKQLRYKRQATYGVAADTASGQSLPRVTSDINLTKETFRSNGIRTDQQRADMRHGGRTVAGTVNDELKVGVHKDFFESFCRQNWQAGASSGAQTTIAAAVTTGNMGTLTRSAGSFLTDGFKVGDVVRGTGWTTTATGNNNKNMLVIALTATVMTVLVLMEGGAVSAKAAGDSVTITLKGKKTWVPLTGHTNHLYTFEHFYADLNESELFDSCRVSTLNVNLPASGLATIDIGIMGRNMATKVGEYFVNPAVPVAGNALAAVNGALVIDGQPVATLTGLTIQGTANASTGQVVGSNVSPDIFMGSIDVTGNITAYFTDTKLRDMFLNETEASIVAAFTSDNTAAADFLSFVMPRIKAGAANRDDGDKGLTVTVPYTALLNVAGGAALAALATTISIQDSTIV